MRLTTTRRRSALMIATVITVLLVAVIGAKHLIRPKLAQPTAPPLLQDAYIWQRNWTPAVAEAARVQAPSFRHVIVLADEISPREKDRVVEVQPNYLSMTQSIHSVGVAVRVGPLPASMSSAFDPASTETRLLCETSIRAVAAARAASLDVVELQIDFDCAESKLAGYTHWVRAVQFAVRPVSVVITALPSWLRHPEFKMLAETAGGFVLQVHSLHSPTGPTSRMTLCDPAEARQAVATASSLGVPFRVALPTYSYLAGFSAEGKLLGLSAEGPTPSWPSDAIIRQMDADPSQLAALVREWSASRPKNMSGIIWYRMPVDGERFNWPAVTLHAVMTGIVPAANIIIIVERPEPGLIDVYLKNIGNAVAVNRYQAEATCGNASVQTCEGLDGFDALEQEPSKVIFRDTSTGLRRIAPGERVQIGWLRLSTDREVNTRVTEILH